MSQNLSLGAGKELGEILQKGGVLKTQCLFNDYYLLANDNMAVLVDTLRPRIVGLFTYGKFGTFQQLLYDTPWVETMGVGVWGIVPCCRICTLGKVETYYPFLAKRDWDDPNLGKEALFDKPKEVIFSDNENVVKIKGITYQPESGSGQKLPASGMEVQLKDNKLILKVEYPVEPRITEIRTLWYPLYRTHEEPGQKRGYMDYIRDYNTIVGPETLLTDIEGRMPRVQLTSKHQRWEIKAETDRKRMGAHRLEISARGRVKKDEIEIEVLENPVMLAVNPYLKANQKESILVLSKEPVKMKVDGEKVDAKSHERGFEAQVLLKRGKHHIKAESSQGMSERKIFAIGDLEEQLQPVGELLLRMQYKEMPLKGIFPYAYYPDTLDLRVNHYGEEVAGCCAYGIRVGSFLSAAIMLYNDERYKKALLDMLEAYERLNHVFEDGGILLGSDYSLSGGHRHYNYRDSGKYAEDAINLCRVINQLDAINTCIHGYTAFKSTGEKEQAIKCLEYGIRFTLPLFKMQDQFPDGRLHWWYMYWNLKPFSNDPEHFMQMPLGIQVLELADIIEQEKLSMAVTPDNLREFVRKQIKFLDSLPPERLATLSGGEATANSSSFRSILSTGYIMRAMLDSERSKEYLEKAREAGILAILSTQAFPYAPQFYLQQADNAATYYLQLEQGYEKDSALSSKGDMDDGTAAQVGLIFRKFLDPDLGELIIDYTLATRMATSIWDNGAICECEIDVPGRYYKRKDITYLDVNCATLGRLACYKASKEVII